VTIFYTNTKYVGGTKHDRDRHASLGRGLMTSSNCCVFCPGQFYGEPQCCFRLHECLGSRPEPAMVPLPLVYFAGHL